MNSLKETFLWKYIDIDLDVINEITSLYLKSLPLNNHFFQPLSLGIQNFLDLEVKRFVLIQVEPFAIGRIHTDFRPAEFGDCLAINIPLQNCENSVTEIWKCNCDSPVRYTSNGQPYRYFDKENCIKISEFFLNKPVLFRTDLPHSVSNKSNKTRRAMSIRFKDDPWHLIL